VFQTANKVRVVSEVVLVVISVVAAPPRVSAQPPKEYPALVVDSVLASDSVLTRRESVVMRFEVSVAGTGMPNVLPSKTIVGSSGVDAFAVVGIEIRQLRTNRPVITIEIALFDPDTCFEFNTSDIL
jgi:hypothetical protein